MNRREILKYVAFATGAAISTPLLTSILSGCNTPATKNEEEYVLTFFSPDEFSKLKEIIDLILPKTESPSATEVGVHQIIDTMVGTVYKSEEKTNYRKNFEAMMKPVQSVIVEDTGKASHHVEVIQTMNVRQTLGYQEMPDTYFDL